MTAPGTVKVPPTAELEKLRKALDDAVTKVNTSRDAISSMMIVSGEFDAGIELDKKIVDRRVQLVELLNNIAAALSSMETKLEAAMKTYDRTGDITTVDATTFHKELIELLKGNLPGLTGV